MQKSRVAMVSVPEDNERQEVLAEPNMEPQVREKNSVLYEPPPPLGSRSNENSQNGGPHGEVSSNFSAQDSERSSSSVCCAEDCAVYIRDLRVAGDRNVHTSLANLTLPRGKIYGLYGPDGDAKQFLIRCILGREQPKQGQVLVLGRTPGSQGSTVPGLGVGHKPKNIILDPDATILQTILFFARLHDMPWTLIEDRVDELIEVLDLSDYMRKVKNLSQNEKSRVSLAVALVHSPPLLVLEEPFHGLDELNRKQLWDYIMKLNRADEVSVLIPTEDIDMARRVNIVGYMRDDRFLGEGSPEELMKDSQCSTLGDVFLQLCIEDRNEFDSEDSDDSDNDEGIQEDIVGASKNNNIVAIEHSEKNAQEPEALSEGGITLTSTKSLIDYNENASWSRTLSDSWRRINLLVLKNEAMENRWLFCFSVGALLLYLFVLCLVMTMPPSFPITVINSDMHSELSQLFLESLPPRIIVVQPYPGIQEAIAGAERSETFVTMKIGQNFSAALRHRFSANVSSHEPPIYIDIDSANQELGLFFKVEVETSLIDFCEDLRDQTYSDAPRRELPVRIRHPIFGDEPIHPDSSFFSLLFRIMFFLHLVWTAGFVTRDFCDRSLGCCFLAGVKPLELIIARILSQLKILLAMVSFGAIHAILNSVPKRWEFVFFLFITDLTISLGGIASGLAISFVCVFGQRIKYSVRLTVFTAIVFGASILPEGFFWSLRKTAGFPRFIFGVDLGRLFFDRRRVVELRLILLTKELDGEVILEPVEEPVSTLEPIKPSATVAESCRTGITSRQRVSGRIAIFLVGCLTTWALMNAEHIHALIERFFDRTERTVVGLLTGR